MERSFFVHSLFPVELASLSRTSLIASLVEERKMPNNTIKLYAARLIVDVRWPSKAAWFDKDSSGDDVT